MAPSTTLTDQIDRLIELFNRRSDDLPDGLFDRRTQFVLNGAPFETLLGQSPTDPLILMLSRGPAGYRFSLKALQHAVPDARIERGEIALDGDRWTCRLWLSGTLRGIDRPIETLIGMRLKLASAGQVEIAEATLEEGDLSLIREARLQS